MKKLLLLLAMTFCIGSANAQNYVTVGADIIPKINITKSTDIVEIKDGVAILKATPETMKQIAKTAHDFKRCGGFFFHEGLDDAKTTIKKSNAKTVSKVKYTLTKPKEVLKAIGMVKEEPIAKFITHLSSFKNRYYQSDTGVKAAHSIRDAWGILLKDIPNSKVELYKHNKWRQPSVVATITGTKYPDEVIVIGGHLDSIAGYWGREKAHAPGADDNASGIATITETIRVLTRSGFSPEKTIQFIGYAAEEVGLRGSAEIAKEYKTNGVNVIGALQLDMTNFKGADKDIYITTDFTNQEQNKFVQALITEYVKVPYGFTSCGYACSDHASWHKNGFPASMPFESDKRGMNSKIHTAGDTLDYMGGDAYHAVNFAKLASAFVIELSK